MKPCRVCGEDIKIAALKCVHCDSWQNWQRLFGFGGTLLSLLVALVAVLTAAVPVILNAVTPKVSQLDFSVQALSPDRVVVLASNSGVRPGTVNNRALVVAGLREYVDTADIGGVTVVEPGHTIPMEFYWETSGSSILAIFVHKCEVRLHYTNFDGSDKDIEVPFNCHKVPVSFAPQGTMKRFIDCNKNGFMGCLIKRTPPNQDGAQNKPGH
jgi:hypothetical protein